jgi:hypothetical protein
MPADPYIPLDFHSHRGSRIQRIGCQFTAYALAARARPLFHCHHIIYHLPNSRRTHLGKRFKYPIRTHAS